MENKKQSNNLECIIIIILLVLLVCGLLVYNKTLDNHKEERERLYKVIEKATTKELYIRTH